MPAAQGSLPVAQTLPGQWAGAGDEGSVAQSALVFFWELAFAQHISVELFVDFALFKWPHEF